MVRRSKTGKRPVRIAKKSYQKVKRAMAKQTKARAVKNMDTHYIKPVIDFNIVPKQGGTVANYVYNNFQLLSSSGAVALPSIDAFKIACARYDRVRVNSIKVTVIPKANVLDQAQAQNDTTLTLNGDGIVHTAVDRDSLLPWLSTGSMPNFWQQYPSYKRYSLTKKFSRKYSVTYPKGVWLDTSNIFEDETLLKRIGLYGNIGLYAQNLVEDRNEVFNEPWASVLVEYSCVFQGTKPQLVSIDNSGVITITSKEPDPTDKDYETWDFPNQDISGNPIV